MKNIEEISQLKRILAKIKLYIETETLNLEKLVTEEAPVRFDYNEIETKCQDCKSSIQNIEQNIRFLKTTRKNFKEHKENIINIRKEWIKRYGILILINYALTPLAKVLLSAMDANGVINAMAVVIAVLASTSYVYVTKDSRKFLKNNSIDNVSDEIKQLKDLKKVKLKEYSKNRKKRDKLKDSWELKEQNLKEQQIKVENLRKLEVCIEENFNILQNEIMINNETQKNTDKTFKYTNNKK